MSTSTSFDDQLLYKLATIETKVGAISDQLVQTIIRLEQRIDDRTTAATLALNNVREQVNKEIGEMKGSIKTNERRIDQFEDWKNKTVAKFGGMLAVVTFIWATFGSRIEEKLGTLF